MAKADKVKVAILREEGSNGDREMAAAIHSAGMEPWDVTMSDLLDGAVSLEAFRGIVFVGGFSYADVLDSAKGWAGSIKFNEPLWNQFRAFYDRARYLLARRVQRVPADGAAGLCPRRERPDRSPTPSSRALFTTTRADSRVAGSPWASTKTPPR